MTTLQSANGAMTSQQRRNYIDTVRRMQPLDDLLRKAKKANRRGWRRTYAGIEGLDYLFARDWRWHLERHATTVATFRLTFCSLCRKFADVGQPVKHKPRCPANPVDDGPYPGWASTSSQSLEPGGER